MTLTANLSNIGVTTRQEEIQTESPQSVTLTSEPKNDITSTSRPVSLDNEVKNEFDDIDVGTTITSDEIVTTRQP